MNKAKTRNVLLFVAAFSILSALPLFPVKDSFVPIAFAYQNLLWLILNWNEVYLESCFEGYFAHSIAIVIAHWAMSLALTLYILKRIKKNTMQRQQDKED